MTRANDQMDFITITDARRYVRELSVAATTVRADQDVWEHAPTGRVGVNYTVEDIDELGGVLTDWRLLGSVHDVLS